MDARLRVMAELLLRVVDKVGADLYTDCQLLKRGDVVVIVPDGWHWGTEERTNPEWRILKLPLIDSAQLQQFLAPEPVTDPARASRTRLRRGWKLDVDARLPSRLTQYLADRTRRKPSFTWPVRLPEFDRWRVQKRAVLDPLVIG